MKVSPMKTFKGTGTFNRKEWVAKWALQGPPKVLRDPFRSFLVLSAQSRWQPMPPSCFDRWSMWERGSASHGCSPISLCVFSSLVVVFCLFVLETHIDNFAQERRDSAARSTLWLALFSNRLGFSAKSHWMLSPWRTDFLYDIKKIRRVKKNEEAFFQTAIINGQARGNSQKEWSCQMLTA